MEAIGRATGTVTVRVDELHLIHEAQHLRRLFAFLEVDCVFDVGANRGQYARMLRERVGFRGPIVSFEPQPHLLDHLRAAAAADPLWEVEGVALDRQAGKAVFQVMQGDEFSSLRTPAVGGPALFAEHMQVRDRVEVTCSTLALEVPRQRGRLGFRRPFLKMDTQGHDLAVLEGASDELGSFVGLQSELAFRQVYQDAPGFDSAIARYRAAGFELSALVPNNAGHFPMLIEMDCIMLRRDLTPATHR